MTEEKQLNKDQFSWGHFGVILFHLILAAALIYISLKSPVEIALKYTFFIGIILGLFSILALIPVFLKYNKDYKYIIDMN